MRSEDIQESLDEDNSSLRDYSDMDPDYEAMTRSCPLPEGDGERGVRNGDRGERSSPCPSSVPPAPLSHVPSPASSSGGSGGGVVRMTSFAEQKFRKLEGRSSGGTTPEISELNVPNTPPTQTATPEVSRETVSLIYSLNSLFLLCVSLSLSDPHRAQAPPTQPGARPHPLPETTPTCCRQRWCT